MKDVVQDELVAIGTAPDAVAAPRPSAVGRWAAAVRERFPEIFFFAGLIWDLVALGRGSKPWDLWLLLGYNIVSAVVLFLIGRGIGTTETPPTPETPRPRLRWTPQLYNWTLQFCYGGTFASLTVLYFISASSWSSLFFVGMVSGVLVANEYLERRYGQLPISLTMFSISAMMYLSFTLPILFGTVKPLWFYLSMGGGLGLAYALKRVARIRVSFIPPCAVAALLVVAFLLHWTPPVPMVKRVMSVCRNLDYHAKPYTAEIETPPFWFFWKVSDRTVHLRPGERLWCVTSVYLPPRVSGELVYRWYYDDPDKGWIVRTDPTVVTLRGGREDGFRARSWRDNPRAGTWVVQAETPGGQVIATTTIRVERVAAGTPVALETIRIR